MATKKSPKPHSSDVRVGDVTADSLDDQLNELDSLLAGLRGASAALRSGKITSLTIDGVTKLARGMQLIAEFDAKLRVAMVKAGFR